MPNSTPGELTVDGITLELVLQRKRVKNVNARLRGTTLRWSARVVIHHVVPTGPVGLQTRHLPRHWAD